MSSYGEYTYKIVVIGDGNCGKSSIVRRLVENKFTPEYQSTIGVEFDSYTVTVKDKQMRDKPIKMYIWDTAGQEQFRTITRSYYRDAVAAVLLYDVTKRSTFNHLESWIKELKQNSNISHKHVILVGNKDDLDYRRQVTTEEAVEFARVHDLNAYIETSAKTGHLVRHVFTKLAQDIYNVYDDAYFKDKRKVVDGIVKFDRDYYNRQYFGEKKKSWWSRWCAW